MNVGYHDILRVWREADAIGEIEHAWLFDHLMPIGGDPDGPIFEGWTLLSALAAQTRRLLWTEAKPFDFDGTYVHLTGAFGNPKPIQRPHPPILIGGRSAALLRVVAEHADLWNIPGGDIDDVIARSALLDRYCAEIDRDPASVIRSIYLPVSYDQPSITQDAIGEAIDAGFRHVVLGLPAPYPANAARWVTDELITTSA
jgi:alkanesulfonate monooxygenase SsuD/methylene tetrahydromethanopterin reductase-like flavin-dependent oxidoreductase (luciferase family)